MDFSRILRSSLLPVVTALFGVVAIAGAVVLKPAHHANTGYLENVLQRIREHAQVDLFDDFRDGLDDWQSSGDRGIDWAYDRSGIVSPRRLSFFQPSMGLTDYDVDALVQIETNSLGFAFRALSPHSYQVAKLMVTGSGPLASLALERYPVISGRALSAVVTRYPEKIQAGKFYRVHLEVRDAKFSIYFEDKLLDYWSDPRLPAGGLGLFCSQGDHAHVAWIRVTHNPGVEGQLCAWLSMALAK